LNDAGYNYVCSALPDNNSLLLGNHYFPDGSQQQGVSMSFRGTEGWRRPTNLYIHDFRNTSKKSEFTMSPDGNVMIMSISTDDAFTKRDLRHLFVSFLTDDTVWTKPQFLSFFERNNRRDSAIRMAINGNTFEFVDSAFAVERGFYIRTFENQRTWSSTKRICSLGSSNSLGKSVYVTSGGMKFALLDSVSEGNRKYFISFEYVMKSWSQPENLGAMVNSDSADITPFIAADGMTLYFSSNRRGGHGSNDIYMTKRSDDTWKHWSRPMNLGYPINTPGWDAYYTVPASGQYAYFVSTVDGLGKSDIFRIKLPESAMPAPVLLVTGKVLDIHGSPVPAYIYYERISDKKQLGSATANPANGDFTLALPGGEMYGFRAEHEGYFPISENLDLRGLRAYKEISKNLVLVPIASGNTIRLNNIFFDYDKAILGPESESELTRLVSFLSSHPDLRIEISGHTDNHGTDEYNANLSQARAQAVLDYVISKGISSSRLVAKGYGESKPIDTNETDAGRQMNRRVEFTIF